MAGSGGSLRKVLKLKEWLRHTQDPPKIMKALKGLQVLEISLDTLVETGVGKTVNSFRKHPIAGNLAKSLISHWKKLVPQDHVSEFPKRKHIKKGKDSSAKNKRKLSLKENKHSEKSPISSSSCKTSPSSDKQKKAHSLKVKKRNEDSDGFLRHTSEMQNNDIYQKFSGGLEMNSSRHIGEECKKRYRSSEKHKSFTAINKTLNKSHSSSDNREASPFLKVEKYKDQTAEPKHSGLKETLTCNSRSKSPSSEDFEPPTMSFESYLNYDQVSSRKKKKACAASRKVVDNTSVVQKSVTSASVETEEEALKSDYLLETPTKKAKTSLQDLLNMPLPKRLPEISISSPPYATEFKAPPAVEVLQQRSDMVQFTGQRLNSKMQVYSGSKMVYLSKMLTLYEQCIRVLQNNIDSLHEVGWVPFEILEPVLTHCTSEQLFRIEDCNPAYMEQSEHLWKKHCQRDFRNEQPLKYESWRGMYLRVFGQREEKLKSLTRSILSAQSEKPKGRQVKIVSAHCTGKPLRSVRCQQGIHGTAGSVQSEMKHLQSRGSGDLSASTSCNKSTYEVSTSSSTYTNETNQDAKKTSKKIAPIMKKSLRAFKNRIGPR